MKAGCGATKAGWTNAVFGAMKVFAANPCWYSCCGWAALYSNERKIASGIGGGVGKCAPCGW